jgi:hypothetical protein
LRALGGKHWAKPVPPKTDGLVADVDPALGQQILDVAQRQRGRLRKLTFQPRDLRMLRIVRGVSGGLSRGLSGQASASSGTVTRTRPSLPFPLGQRFRRAKRSALSGVIFSALSLLA